jgi:cell division protein FtsL
VSVAAPARAPARSRRRPAPPAPVAVPRRARRVRPRRLTIGGAAWVILLAALLGGIVALNVAALRDSIEVNRLQAQARRLSDENQLTQNRVTSLSSPVAIGREAAKLGMHPADPNTTRYVSLPARRPAAAKRP